MYNDTVFMQIWNYYPTHTHACMHAHRHTHTHACMHAHRHTHTQTHTHTEAEEEAAH